jgi:hypothetical protein
VVLRLIGPGEAFWGRLRFWRRDVPRYGRGHTDVVAFEWAGDGNGRAECMMPEAREERASFCRRTTSRA